MLCWCSARHLWRPSLSMPVKSPSIYWIALFSTIGRLRNTIATQVYAELSPRPIAAASLGQVCQPPSLHPVVAAVDARGCLGHGLTEGASSLSTRKSSDTDDNCVCIPADIWFTLPQNLKVKSTQVYKGRLKTGEVVAVKVQVTILRNAFAASMHRQVMQHIYRSS